MWGVLAGQWLLGGRPPRKKIAILALTGLAGVAAGFALDPVTPIIKRIFTSSFVLASGGTSWILTLVKPFAVVLFSWAGELPAQIATSVAAWAVLWSMCYWLYKRRIVIKI